jgi:hypothetical protein
MKPIDVKQLAHELIDSMPPDAPWKDILYEIYVRQEIELASMIAATTGSYRLTIFAKNTVLSIRET